MINELLLIRPDLSVSPENKQPLMGKIIVSIGAGRGIGAEVNQHLAQLGASIVTIHRDEKKAKKFAPILSRLEATGSPVTSLVGDITRPEVQQQLLDTALSYGDEIFAVNINAAGGATGSEADARQLNVEMPQQIVDLYLPFMAKGGSFIYTGSLWSDNYPKVAMLPGYERVARTKHEAVQNLITDIRRFDEAGVKLRLISAHAVAGTMMIDTILKHKFPEVYEALKSTCFGGEFPDVSDMAAATAYCLRDETAASGKVLYVLGRGHWGYWDPSLLAAYIGEINQALASVALTG